MWQLMTDGVVWDLWSLALMDLLFHYWNTFCFKPSICLFSLILWLSLMMLRPHISSLNWTTRQKRWALWNNWKFFFTFWFSLLLWLLSTYPTFSILDSNTVIMIVDVLMIIGFILISVPIIFLTYIIIRVWFLPQASYKTTTDWIEPTGRFKSSLHWVKYWEDKFPAKWESVSETIYHCRHQYH